MSENVESDPESPEEIVEGGGRHATNLELFLDLVFVFAITQIAGLIGADLSIEGFGKGLLLAWLVWWLWSQFTWLGTAIDLSGRSRTQFFILAAVPPTLLMAVALPNAFGTSGPQFAIAYLVVNLWSLFIQGKDLWGEEVTRRAWLGYAPLATLAPLVLVIGSFLNGNLRVAVWVAAALFNIAGALMGARRDSSGNSEWRIDPTHFAERHALFVIISLGEILIAVGTAASHEKLTTAVYVGLIATTAVACVLWWTYFAYVPDAVEERLRSTQKTDRGQVARDMFTFGHFPIVFGLILYAVVAKHVIGSPTRHLETSDLLILIASVMFFVGGLMGLQWQAIHRVAPERVACVLIIAVLSITAGPSLSGVSLVSIVALLIALMQTITLRRLDRRTRNASEAPT